MRGFWLVAFCLVGITFLAGCSSEDTAEYQSFSQLEPSPVESKHSEPPAELPLVAPRPEPVASNSTTRDTELASGLLRPIRLQVPEKEFRTDPKTGEVILSFADLDLFDVLNMEPVPPNAVEYFPEWMKQLDGKRVSVRGFMVPPPRDRVETFLLARDNAACCMGPETRIYHLMYVLMSEGESVEYLPNFPYRFSGIFRIQPNCEDGYWNSLFVLEDAIRRK